MLLCLVKVTQILSHFLTDPLTSCRPMLTELNGSTDASCEQSAFVHCEDFDASLTTGSDMWSVTEQGGTTVIYLKSQQDPAVWGNEVTGMTQVNK